MIIVYEMLNYLSTNEVYYDKQNSKQYFMRESIDLVALKVITK